jgi:hypothetical protein
VLATWFGTRRPTGIGLPGGPAAGNLVILDFEEWPAFTRWGGLLAADERNAMARWPYVEATACEDCAGRGGPAVRRPAPGVANLARDDAGGTGPAGERHGQLRLAAGERRGGARH